MSDSELTKKAEAGDVEALLALAHLLELGIDRPRDYQAAAQCLQTAVKFGSQLAMGKLQHLVAAGKINKEFLDISAHHTSTPASPSPPVNQGAKILVVDDEPELIELSRTFLEEAGYRVIDAANGDEAFQKVLQHPDIKLIICDIKMPKVNGISFIRTLRGTKAADTAHVIIISAFASPDLIAEGKRLNIKTWLVKPVNMEKLIETVQEILSRRGHAA